MSVSSVLNNQLRPIAGSSLPDPSYQTAAYTVDGDTIYVRGVLAWGDDSSPDNRVGYITYITEADGKPCEKGRTFEGDNALLPGVKACITLPGPAAL